MATQHKKAQTFSMSDASELKTTQGTSFLIYGSSASRKTRTLGTMPDQSVTLHISLDNGANSATDAAKVFGNGKATHKITVPKNLQELNDVIIALHTNKLYKDNIDSVVIDNYVVISNWIKSYIFASPRYKRDALHIEDAVKDDTGKNAESKKMQPFYLDLQRITNEFMQQVNTLTSQYNVFMLAGETETKDSMGQPLTTVLVNGPASIAPMVFLFSEVYRTDFKEGDFDSKDHTATFFKISTYTDKLTGQKLFAKTRNIKDLKSLQTNTIKADFNHILSNEIGYIWKKDRKEVK